MPSSVTLLQPEYFVAAVEHTSFSAAGALHVAQPSLSAQIRRLEDRLGVVRCHGQGLGEPLAEGSRRALYERRPGLHSRRHG